MTLLARSLLFLALLAGCGPAGAAQNNAPRATVTAGEIEGLPVPRGGVVFLGIPFAQPPVGPLRWREPQPVKPWTGVRTAKQYGNSCAQLSIWGMPTVLNEDCLYLNVWTPLQPGSKKRLPVMVWIHGGANFAGNGHVPGDALISHNVVVVTIAYRLGIFGFLAHPELTRESPHHASGNYGLLDQIAALDWVQQNISKFGGDPGNVTVFGESAGALDITLLMTSPMAKGKFQRAIVESGLLLNRRQGMPPPLAAAEADGAKIASSLGAAGSSLQELRQDSIEQLLDAYKKVYNGNPAPALGANVDGYVLPRAPLEVFRKGEETGVALLIGNNSREFSSDATPQQLKEQIESLYGDLAPKAFPLYGLRTAADGGVTTAPADPLLGNSGAQWETDIVFRCTAAALVAMHTAAGHATYQYQFERALPGHEAAGAAHASEVAYVFGNLENKGPGAVAYTTVDHDISQAMQEYWTNFAKKSDPNGEPMPEWPIYKANAGGYLEFTNSGPVGRRGKLRGPQCDLFQEALKQVQ